MIYYFSGTGNSQYVAQRIAEMTGDTLCFIPTVTDLVVPDDGEAIGFVFPVYFWGIPTSIERFAKSLQVRGQHYLYTVLTCGASTGSAAMMFEKCLGHKLSAQYSVVMPDTYAPMFDCGDMAKNNAILDSAESEIDNIVQKLKARETGNLDKHHGAGKLATVTMYPFYRRTDTKKFSVSKDCVGCGCCERVCSQKVITLQNGLPVWNPGHCDLCLACLHHCPYAAIQYGKSSKHGQYLCPRVKK